MRNVAVVFIEVGKRLLSWDGIIFLTKILIKV